MTLEERRLRHWLARIAALYGTTANAATNAALANQFAGIALRTGRWYTSESAEQAMRERGEHPEMVSGGGE